MSVDYGKKKAPARTRVLELLSDLEWHTWRELNMVGGVRYSARILELKRLGYEIVSIDPTGEGEGRRYKLTSTVPGKPKDKKIKVFLIEEDAIKLIKLIETLEAYTTPTIPAVPLSRRTLDTLKEALGSFQANREKL